MPTCELDGLALFEDADTVAPLELVVEPPEAMREAFAALAALQQLCADGR